MEFQSARPSPLAVPHGEQPINEFRNNDHLLYSCFPLLFLLGKGLLSSGPLKLEAKRHMLLSYDNRHGACTRLNFLLFNQDQRHQTALATACYIKSRSESTALFAKWARDPTFLHPTSRSSTKPILSRSFEAFERNHSPCTNSGFQNSLQHWAAKVSRLETVRHDLSSRTS